jgi:phospholipid/cholesterol/gamma-HCH transport system ATP-binding protein
MGMIQIRNLSVSFNGLPILREVNLTAEKGTTVVILGSSGAGKSVLLKSIIGLIAPDKGSIRIDGEEVVGMNPKELYALRRRMGYLFQSAALYDSMSVRDNLEFSLRRQEVLDEGKMNQRVTEHLRLVGLEHAIGKMPSELSGGMKKRVGLARALITRPEIMLYDEPTTGLDPITSNGISQLILKLGEQNRMTSIAVTHDMSCARMIADKVAVLNEGAICFEGEFDELRNSKEDFVKRFIASA